MIFDDLFVKDVKAAINISFILSYTDDNTTAENI